MASHGILHDFRNGEILKHLMTAPENKTVSVKPLQVHLLGNVHISPHPSRLKKLLYSWAKCLFCRILGPL